MIDKVGRAACISERYDSKEKVSRSKIKYVGTYHT